MYKHLVSSKLNPELNIMWKLITSQQEKKFCVRSDWNIKSDTLF